MRLSLLATALVSLVACVQPPGLLPGAHTVQLTRGEPVSGLQVAGAVYCRLGGNARSTTSNAAGCQNDLRNQAAQVGATVVIVTHEQYGTQLCNNCVTLQGTAYRPVASASAPAPAAQVVQLTRATAGSRPLEPASAPAAADTQGEGAVPNDDAAQQTPANSVRALVESVDHP